MGYLVQLTDDGLSLRTVRNYLRHILAARKGISLLSGLTKNLHLAIIKAPRRHALDIQESQFLHDDGLLEHLFRLNARVAAIACFMAWSGLRYADLTHIERQFMVISTGDSEFQGCTRLIRLEIDVK